MKDIHCHILPGVDDGSSTMRESVRMLKAAQNVGITSMVCTPHCRNPWYDYEAMQAAFKKLKPLAQSYDIEITMGFEVNHEKLVELGCDVAPMLAFEGTSTFLLELTDEAPASKYEEYERTILELQAQGLEVIIAHPERYEAIQQDLNLAKRLVDMGCKLQASGNCLNGNWRSRRKKCAKALFKQGLYSYIASDAHMPEHYEEFAHVYELHKHNLAK